MNKYLPYGRYRILITLPLILLSGGCSMKSAWHLPELPETTAHEQAAEPQSSADTSLLVQESTPAVAVPAGINRQPFDLSKAAPTDIAPQPPADSLRLELQGVALTDVVAQFADILGFDYVIDGNVKGKVSLSIKGEVAKENIWPLFTRILNLHGATITKEQQYYRILPVNAALSELPEASFGGDLDAIASEGRMLVQFIVPRHLSVEVLAQNLEPFLGQGGAITPLADNGLLYIVDSASNIQRLLTLTEALDQSAFSRKGLRFIGLKEASASDVVAELESIFGGVNGEQTTTRFIPLERINGLLLVGDSRQDLTEAERWIDLLDRQYQGGGERVFIYKVQNVKATELAETLNEIYSAEESSGPAVASTQGQAKKVPAKPMMGKAPTKAASQRREVAAGTVTGSVRIIPDSVANALIIKARPSDYDAIRRTISDLDGAPLAAAINVFIAELLLNEGETLGVEYTKVSDDGKNTFSLDSGLLGSALSGGIFTRKTETFDLLLNAYHGDNRLNVLSSPTVVVRNNEPASIEVGADVPILTQSLTSASDTQAVTNTVEYRYAGIQLKVTPHINEDGIVTMELRQEVSSTASNSVSGIDSPQFNKRVVETSLVARDGESIFIGGLLERRKERSRKGLLWLSKIPVLGAMFRNDELTDRQVELVMVITPTVIYDFKSASQLSQRYIDRIEDLRLGKFIAPTVGL